MDFPQTARQIMDLHQLPTQAMGLNQPHYWLQISHQSRQELCSCHLTTHSYESMAHPPPTKLTAKLWPIHLLPNYDQSTSYQTMTNAPPTNYKTITNPPPTKLQNYDQFTSYQTMTNPPPTKLWPMHLLPTTKL